MGGCVGKGERQLTSSMNSLLSESGFVLPYNYKSIIEQSDNIVDTSSVGNFYEHLAVGIYLNGNLEKYWVTKQEGHYYNCFMLYAERLLKHGGIVVDEFEAKLLDEYRNYWVQCTVLIPERDGTLVSVAKTKSSPRFIKPKHNGETEVERFSHVTEFEFPGMFNTRNLNLGITYEIYFVVMLSEGAYERPISASARVNFFYEPSKSHQHTLHDKPRDEWIQLLAGRFKVTESTKVIIFSLDGLVPGMLIKGVVIEPVF